MKHTKTPWMTTNLKNHGGRRHQIMSETGVFIATCGGKETSFAEDNDNARHIVKCVNSHDELLEALKYVLAEIDNSNGLYVLPSRATDKINNAIAKAEGK